MKTQRLLLFKRLLKLQKKPYISSKMFKFEEN